MVQRFIDQLKNSLEEGLPGEEVQFLMAPLARRRMKGFSESPDYRPRKSAVLILLYPFNNSIHTVLIERHEYKGVHSGQIAFPGGKFEEKDIDLRRTALREAQEEVGLLPQTIEIIGHLSDVYIPPSNFLVSPYIGFSTLIPDFISDAREVKKIIPIDLFKLNDPKIKGEKIIKMADGLGVKTPYYEIEGFTVWGATAMMISELNAVVAPISF